MLPAYMLGRNPDLRIVIASYSFSLARRFGLAVQRTIASDTYSAIFPETKLKGTIGNPAPGQRSTLRTAAEFDCVGRSGGVMVVGREGSLTGSRVDVMILDDLYKDALEANSPLIRENAWQWYNAVVRTRLHNDSQEVIVCTRWHEEDIIGRLTASAADGEVFAPSSIEALDTFLATPGNTTKWVAVNFEALKRSPSSPLDPRSAGEALWPERHSAERLAASRAIDPVTFEALYQGNPSPAEGLLYGPFGTYDELPDEITARSNYTDTADTGDDRLCSICYATDAEGVIYLTDVLYTPEPMEVTERAVAEMLVRNGTRQAVIESNNGGRGFARAVTRLLSVLPPTERCAVRTFHQSANKQSRILTNAPTVCASVLMPRGWRALWPDFAADITAYRRTLRANRYHDAPDALTGIIETESEGRAKPAVRRISFSK